MTVDVDFAFLVYGLSSMVAFGFPMAFRIANNFLDNFSL